MSWEDSPPTYRTCPCGKGTFSIVHRSDDWGRVVERWEMQCPSCSTAYRLYVTSFNHKGAREDQHRWVKQPLLHSVAKAERAVQAAERRVQTYMQRELRARWLKHFVGKSKKAIWSELTDDGANYPALPTFYEHVRQSSLEAVLLGYLYFDQVPTVCNILGVIDNQLTALVLQVRECEARLKEAHEKARASADA